WLHGGTLADRLVTNGEYAEFIADGGYERATLWLSADFATVKAEGWRAPLYWREIDGVWHEFTLAGLAPIDPNAPVTHVSHHEADAYARWADARLPTEGEWEVVAATQPLRGRFVEYGRFHPGGDAGPGLRQLVGDAWQWTSSAYLGYPGYRPATGAIGEYNGKFMSDQWVLRGASCATPASHVRWSYRNFFPSDARWQFSGIRLARDLR
ncbi:MAG: SUMF1/EgtB/PvdO family nonheme iron enzyme, partial [Gemmatimonadaceae bacterium]|nr:SUMF1/EgtB/PvdO family nonheme iron enzyme [Gemmatimonadaceae bacterium]